MYRYRIEDGKLVKTEFESDKTLDAMINRTFAEVVSYTYAHYDRSGNRLACGQKNKDNSIFRNGLGTKTFSPSGLVKWDTSMKCFVWKDDRKPYVIYDATNVRLTNRGFYLSNFDVSTLPDAKNKKANKKKYALLNTLCEDALADCQLFNKRAMEDPTFDYTRDDRLNEYRAWWAIRQLISKAFKENKRISVGTLTDMFVRTDYSSEFSSSIYTFGKYMREGGQELIDRLIAETEKDGKSGGGRLGSDDGRP